MNNIIIRQASVNDLNDLNDLIKISRNTFTETFASDNSEEDLNTFLDQAYSPTKLSKELIQIHSTFYLCFVNHQLGGYLKLNTDENQS